MEPQSQPGQQCLFCQIASGAVPSRKLYEDDQVMAMLDIHPAAPGHILILPKQHVAMMPQLKPETLARISVAVKVLSKALLQAMQCQGTTVFMANGGAAGQRVPHLLVHLIPRQPKDGIPVQLEEQDVEEGFLLKLREKLIGTQAAEKKHDIPKKKDDDEDGGEEPPEEKPIEPAEEEDAGDEEGGNTLPGGNKTDLDLIESLFG